MLVLALAELAAAMAESSPVLLAASWRLRSDIAARNRSPAYLAARTSARAEASFQPLRLKRYWLHPAAFSLLLVLRLAG